MSVSCSGSLWVGRVSDMALNRHFTCWQNSEMSLLFVRKWKSDRKEFSGLWNTLGVSPAHPSWAQWNLGLTGEDRKTGPFTQRGSFSSPQGVPGQRLTPEDTCSWKSLSMGHRCGGHRGGQQPPGQSLTTGQPCGDTGERGQPPGQQFQQIRSVSTLESIKPVCVHVYTCALVRDSERQRPAESSSRLKRLRSWHVSPVSPVGFEVHTARSAPIPAPSASGPGPALGGSGCLPAPWASAHQAPGLGREEASLDAWSLRASPGKEGVTVLRPPVASRPR